MMLSMFTSCSVETLYFLFYLSSITDHVDDRPRITAVSRGMDLGRLPFESGRKLVVRLHGQGSDDAVRVEAPVHGDEVRLSLLEDLLPEFGIESVSGDGGNGDHLLERFREGYVRSRPAVAHVWFWGEVHQRNGRFGIAEVRFPELEARSGLYDPVSGQHVPDTSGLEELIEFFVGHGASPPWVERYVCTVRQRGEILFLSSLPFFVLLFIPARAERMQYRSMQETDHFCRPHILRSHFGCFVAGANTSFLTTDGIMGSLLDPRPDRPASVLFLLRRTFIDEKCYNKSDGCAIFLCTLECDSRALRGFHDQRGFSRTAAPCYASQIRFSSSMKRCVLPAGR